VLIRLNKSTLKIKWHAHYRFITIFDLEYLKYYSLFIVSAPPVVRQAPQKSTTAAARSRGNNRNEDDTADDDDATNNVGIFAIKLTAE